jgi:hypothetical protein
MVPGSNNECTPPPSPKGIIEYTTLDWLQKYIIVRVQINKSIEEINNCRDP